MIGPVTRGTFWESVAVPDIRGAGGAGGGAADAASRHSSEAESQRLTAVKECDSSFRWNDGCSVPLRLDHDPEQRAAALAVADADRAAMGEDDLAGEAEADAGALLPWW